METITFKYTEFIVGSGYTLEIPFALETPINPAHNALWLKLNRDEAMALRDQIDEALMDGMLAERIQKFAAFGLAEDDKVAITPPFQTILDHSEWSHYGIDVWKRASSEGKLVISLALRGQDHLADFVGIYNPYFGKSIYVQPGMAQAMKAAYLSSHKGE